MDPTNRRIRKIDKDSQRFVAQALGNTNLSLSDYDMIHTVQHRPGITQEQLRQKYAQDKSTIAGGYIERRPHPEDGRRKQLFITEKGAAIRNAKVDAESFYYEWLTAELNQEELDVLRPLLNRLQLRSRDERRQEFVHLLKLYTDTHGGQSGAKK